MIVYAYLEGWSKRFSTQWLPTHSEPKDKGCQRKLQTPRSCKFKILHRDASGSSRLLMPLTLPVLGSAALCLWNDFALILRCAQDLSVPMSVASKSNKPFLVAVYEALTNDFRPILCYRNCDCFINAVNARKLPSASFYKTFFHASYNRTWLMEKHAKVIIYAEIL